MDIKSGELVLKSDGQETTLEELSRVADQAIAFGIPKDARITNIRLRQYFETGYGYSEVEIRWKAKP